MMFKISIVCFAILVLYVELIVCRKHKIKLKSEDREKIVLSSFGFLKGGYLKVNITGLEFNLDLKDASSAFGLTLCKKSGSGLPNCWENIKPPDSSSCPFNLPVPKNTDMNMVSFRFNFTSFNKNGNVTFRSYGESLKNLTICDASEAKHPKRKRREVPIPKSTETTPKPPTTSPQSSSSATTSTLKVSRTTVGKPTEPTLQPDSKISVSTTFSHPLTTTTLTVATIKSGSTTSFSSFPTNDACGNNKLIGMTVVEKARKKSYKVAFNVSFDENYEGLYDLYFHNCHNILEPRNSVRVNLSVTIVEENSGGYLSAGEMPLPNMYFSFCAIFMLVSCVWIYYLRENRSNVKKVHYIMLVLVYLKCISYLFHAINYHYINVTGEHEKTWAILYYIVHLLKGALLFITIVLIGTGWAFIKHFLSDREKKIFLIVIPLQILANVAQIIIEESDESASEFNTWKEVFILVDLLCCGAILFPIVWSIRHLQDAASTDGKVAINLEKLKLFRHFYITIVVYIYFTRIIVYLLKITVPFQYVWLYEMFRELATLIFFLITGYKFRPISNNPYLRVATEEEDPEEDVILTRSGAYENVSRVNTSKYYDKGSDSEEGHGNQDDLKRLVRHSEFSRDSD